MTNIFNEYIYLSKNGLISLIKKIKFGKKAIWHGTEAEWNALSDTEKNKYDQAEIIDNQ